MLAFILLGLVVATVGVLILVVLFRYRLSEVVFLGAAMLPIVWLSRLHLHYVTIADSTFVLLWAAFSVLFLVGLVLGNRNAGRAVRQSSRRVVTCFCALVGLMLISNLTHSGSKADVVRGIAAVLFVVLPFVAARSAVRMCRANGAGVQRAVVALLLAGNLLACISIVSAFAPGVSQALGVGATYETFGYARAYSPLGGANGTGMVLVMVYCLAFGEMLAKRHRALAIFTLATAFTATLATLARGALIGLVVANLFLLLGQSRGLGRRLAITIAVGCFLLIPLAYKMNQSFTLERLNLAQSGALTGASTAARMDTMRASLRYGFRHIILGGGWGLVYESPRLRYAYKQGSADRMIWLDGMVSLATPHSLPALVLVESGGLALILLGAFAWTMWRSLRHPNPRSNTEEAGLIHGFRAGVLGFLFVSLAQDNLFLSDRVAYCFYLFLFTGLLTASVSTVSPIHVVAQPEYESDVSPRAVPTA